MSSAALLACPDCVSRALLLSSLAANIDRLVARRSRQHARELLALADRELVAAACPDGGEELLRRVRTDDALEALSGRLLAEGCWSSCRHRGPYPTSLQALGEAAPHAVFGVGHPEPLAEDHEGAAVTIVGSRRAGSYGNEVAEQLARDLSNAGLTVISGLALGIDSAVHEGALAGATKTVAVLGTGPERPYPRSRRGLYGRIRSSGTVISELPPGTPTFRWMFPARNRLMAAMAGLTVVVEAAERSGSLITAEMALEIGRLVGAVPGPVSSWRSSGTNRLIAEGAVLVRDAADVLDAMLGPGARPLTTTTGPPLDGRAMIVLDAVEGGAVLVDEIAAVAGLGYAQALAALNRLERHGYLRSDLSGAYARTALPAPAVTDVDSCR